MRFSKLLSPEPFTDMVMGNHAIARAMLESGTQVMTTYPGSPTPEIAAALQHVPRDERSFYFEYSVNEKVAVEVACGAAMNGHLSSAFFKSVGLNVALDSLIQLPMLELVGGMVVIIGDDPGAHSSQNEQDNRHIARMAHMPMLEPATPEEAYQMYVEAARLAKQMRAPIFLRITTHVAHARAPVAFGQLPAKAPDWTPRFDKANGPYWPIAANVFPLKQNSLEKLARFEAVIETLPHTPVYSASKPNVSRGIIASGLPALFALETVHSNQAPIDLLKLGVTHPIPKKTVAAFLRKHTSVLVLEELDRILEKEIKLIAYEERIDCHIYVKPARSDEMGELTTDRTALILSQIWPSMFTPPNVLPPPPDTIPRLPQLCPGCGHRSAFFAIKKALEDEDITVGDIGCHTLGALPPYELGEIVLSMGHSVSTGAGLSLGRHRRRVVAFVGDGTLFHAALPGIINAVVNDHDVTLVVLENGTTAMTGHQPRPGTGEVGVPIPLVPLLEHLGVGFIRSADAYHQRAVTDAVKSAMDHRGFAVVVAHHPCMLQRTRSQKKKNPALNIPKIVVNNAACTGCDVCISNFGCPSFKRGEDGQVSVEKSLCIGDGSCIQVCEPNALLREGTKPKQ